MGLLVPSLKIVKRSVIAHELQPVQCRMARAGLGWSLDELATAACVNRKTILRFEKGETTPRGANAEAIRRAFEAAGARFVDDGEFVGVLTASSRSG